MLNNSKLFFCILFFLPFTLIAQKKISAAGVNNISIKSLSAHFSKYSLFTINTKEIKAYIEGAGKANINFELELPGLTNFNFSLKENDILSDSYTLTVSSSAGKQVFPKPACLTYAGELLNESNSKVRLTITPDFIYGIIKSNLTEYFIEPLEYFSKNAAQNIFIVYETKDAIIDPSFICGVTERDQEQQRVLQSGKTTAGLNCVITEMAIASDESMFLRYGTASKVETHNIGVMNNVIWDYTNAQFNNNIEFVIAGQNISTAAGTNQLSPAYTGTNSNTILDNFRAWGQAGNFGFNYDIGQFWTTRNIDGNGAGMNAGIIGLAFLGGVCNSNRYQILEDFSGPDSTGSGYALEVLTAHETGHNFNCVHDPVGSPFIMAPSVSNTHTWSPASIAAVDGFVPSRNCLAQCNISESLSADFASPGNVCTGGSVQFFDRTLGGPTSWEWTFDGGTPHSSIARNPIVTFASPGVKNVILATHNATGSDVKGATIIVSNPRMAACTKPGTGTSNAGINSFSLNTINKVTAGLAVDGNKYFDFSCSDNTILTPGTSYSATANVGTTNPSNSFNLVQFFIDYNNDGDFNDANETVYTSSSCFIGNHTFLFTTLASPPRLNQLLRARLIARDCIGGIDPCYDPSAGQVEDYGIIFLGAEPLCNFNYWTGTAGTAWENSANWSCGTIPGATTNVIIGTGKPNYPQIKSMAICKSLNNVSGTSIRIFTGFKLDIAGSN